MDLWLQFALTYNMVVVLFDATVTNHRMKNPFHSWKLGSIVARYI